MKNLTTIKQMHSQLKKNYAEIGKIQALKNKLENQKFKYEISYWYDRIVPEVFKKYRVSLVHIYEFCTKAEILEYKMELLENLNSKIEIVKKDTKSLREQIKHIAKHASGIYIYIDKNNCQPDSGNLTECLKYSKETIGFLPQVAIDKLISLSVAKNTMCTSFSQICIAINGGNLPTSEHWNIYNNYYIDITIQQPIQSVKNWFLLFGFLPFNIFDMAKFNIDFYMAVFIGIVSIASIIMASLELISFCTKDKNLDSSLNELDNTTDYIDIIGGTSEFIKQDMRSIDSLKNQNNDVQYKSYCISRRLSLR